jgi:iron complex outermembrane recepter protein
LHFKTFAECDIRGFPTRLRSWVLILVVSMPAAAWERPQDATYVFDIPQTSRREALIKLSDQADRIPLVYTPGNVAEGEALVGPIQGKLTLQGALHRILRASEFTWRISKENTLVVEPRGLEKHRERSGQRAKEPPVGPVKTAPAREEVIVSSSPWRSIADSMAPVVVLDRKQLDAIGAPTVSEALRYISQSAFVRAAGFHTSGAQYAEMRGLGSNTALILINGRRALPSASSLISSAFDLNTIPMAAVERIELILDSPAVAHGADAMGGVINIELYRKVTDPTIEVEHGGAAGGAEQRHGSFSIGTDGAKFKGAATFDYFDDSGLLGAERDRWNDQDLRRLGGSDLRSLLSPAGNITSADGYSNIPGLAAPIAAVPLVDVTPGNSRDDFVETAGTSNWESLLKYSSVVPKARRLGLVANGSYEINERVSVAAEVLYSDRDSTFFFCPPAIYGLLVAPGNAYNPFDATVRALRLIPELGTQYQSVESELFRAAIQLQGRWADWKWNISALHSRERSSTWFHNELDLTPQGAVMRALASPDPTQAINPFQSGPLGSEELLRSLLAPPQVDHFVSTGSQLMAYGEGPLFTTPAGAVTAMLGAEWRRESALFDSHDIGWFDSDRDIGSAFLQLNVPLVSADTALPAVQSLVLVAGSRLDRYEGMDSVIRSQLGLHWNPLRSLKIRLSGGRSFRPPTLYELHLPKTTTPFTVRDPARHNELADIAVIAGGNDTLKPTTAKTFTAGFVLSSPTDANWKMSVDYWRVTMDDRVSTVSPLLLLAHEATFPDRITRADPAGADVAAGLPAPLESVDGSPINAGRVKISGADLVASADFAIRRGHFIPELRATWFDSFVATDFPGQPAVQRVNLASDSGSILEWRAILLLRWSQGPFGITTAARYSPAYDDAIAGVRTGREVASQTLFDLHGSVDLGHWFDGDSALSGSKLTIGAFNLLNTAPSVAEVSGAAAFDFSQGDLKQSSYYLRLEKKF